MIDNPFFADRAWCREHLHDRSMFRTAMLYEIRPDILADAMPAVSKRFARVLQDQDPSLTRSSALELVARSTGFQHWNELHTRSKRLRTDFPRGSLLEQAELTKQALTPFRGALPLLTSIAVEFPPSEHHRDALELIAESVSQSGFDRLKVLNALGRFFGAASWDELTSRDPSDDHKPLYAFSSPYSSFKDGAFVVSRVCSSLILEQDSMFQNYRDRGPENQARLEKWLEQTLARRPDFLEGYLAKATILKDDDRTWHQAGPVYKEAIARAEALMPKGFRGEVIWGDIENRFYHRLLYGLMTWSAWSGDYRAALSLARKQLRLNKSDNFDIRILLPSLLVAARRFKEAHSEAENRLRTWPLDVGSQLSLSIGRYAVFDLAGAKRDFLLALFLWPPLRLFLTGEAATPELWHDTRSSVPDAEQLDFLLSIADRALPLESAFRQYLAEPAVIQAETDLRSLWQEDPVAWDSNTSSGNWRVKRWLNEAVARASALSVNPSLEPPMQTPNEVLLVADHEFELQSLFIGQTGGVPQAIRGYDISDDKVIAVHELDFTGDFRDALPRTVPLLLERCSAVACVFEGVSQQMSHTDHSRVGPTKECVFIEITTHLGIWLMSCPILRNPDRLERGEVVLPQRIEGRMFQGS